MSNNVTGNWRFTSPDKGLRSIEPQVRDQGWQNVVEQNTAEALSADWGFTEPEPPTGGDAHTVLLCDGCVLDITFFRAYYIYIFGALLIHHLFS